MDKMLYLAGISGREVMRAQAVNANNLANANTVGFRQDLVLAESEQVYGPGHPTRVYNESKGLGSDLSPGPLMTTGQELDVAMRGEGWFAVQAADGNEAYTRAGDLRVNATGLLTNGAGHPLMGNNGGPIVLPPFEKISIAIDGTITIRPVGQDATTLAVVDRIKMVKPEVRLAKGDDGLFRLPGDGIAPADATAQLVSGALESSNVNVVEAMVNMMSLARKFELQVKMMEQAETNDSSSANLMRMS